MFGTLMADREGHRALLPPAIQAGTRIRDGDHDLGRRRPACKLKYCFYLKVVFTRQAGADAFDAPQTAGIQIF